MSSLHSASAAEASHHSILFLFGEPSPRAVRMMRSGSGDAEGRQTMDLFHCLTTVNQRLASDLFTAEEAQAWFFCWRIER